MSIQDLGSIGELIAAIATVITLLYLAVQIRQNNSTGRANSAAADTQNQNALSLILAQDRELSRVFWTGLESRSQLDVADQRCFDPFMSAFVTNLEQSWRFYQEGAIDDATWDTQIAAIEWLANQPGFQEWWRVWEPTSGSLAFREVIEKARLSESPVSNHTAAAPQSTTTDSV